MKNKLIAIGATAAITAAALAAGGYGLYEWGMKRGMDMASPAPAPAAAAAASVAAGVERRVLYWHDPMVPGTRFDKPGKSPFMDMPLVPVYADSASGPQAGEGGVSVSPLAQQNLGLRTGEVVRGSLATRISAVGNVTWNERQQAVVAARANAFVERLHARALFDPVAAGQPLAELYVPDWVAAQEEFLSLRRMQGPELAGLVDAARQRMRQAGMSDEQIARVAADGTVHARVTVTSPIAGVVGELGTREGAAVAMGTPLLRINGLSTVWVIAELPEALASQVRPGQEVDATTSAGAALQGRVGAVLPEVNATTRTLKLRVEVPNPHQQLVPGMFVTLHFQAPSRQDTLLIPSEALIATGERNLVMVAGGGGRFTPVEVERGAEANGQTEIRRGLQAGQRVVLSGQFLLDSEASLRGVQNRQAASAPGASR